MDTSAHLFGQAVQTILSSAHDPALARQAQALSAFQDYFELVPSLPQVPGFHSRQCIQTDWFPEPTTILGQTVLIFDATDEPGPDTDTRP